MPVTTTYVSHKVGDDDVEAAVAEARKVAAKKLGCDDPDWLKIIDCNWVVPDWVCTRWMWVVNPPPEGP